MFERLFCRTIVFTAYGLDSPGILGCSSLTVAGFDRRAVIVAPTGDVSSYIKGFVTVKGTCMDKTAEG